MALIACAMLFVSCDTTIDGGDKDKENATQLVEVYDAYYSHELVQGVSNDYWMSFFTTEIDKEEGYPKGSCEFVVFEFFPTTIENGFPVGNYFFAEEPQDGYAWAGWEYEEYWAQGSFVYLMEDGEVFEVKYMVSGEVEVIGTGSNAEVFADVVFEDGSKATYYYKGIGVPKNHEISLKWLDVAIENGSNEAVKFKEYNFSIDSMDDECALELDDLSDLDIY